MKRLFPRPKRTSKQENVEKDIADVYMSALASSFERLRNVRVLEAVFAFEIRSYPGIMPTSMSYHNALACSWSWKGV